MGLEDELFKAFKHINFGQGNSNSPDPNKIVRLMINDMRLKTLKDLRTMIDDMINTAEKTKTGTTYHFSSFDQEMDPFKILEVDPEASRETIEKAYRQKAKEAHPDKGGNNERMVKINAAWEAIKIFRGWNH